MEKKQTVGVVVGRFQTPYLHEGHIYLLDQAKAEGRKLFIIVGENGGTSSISDPMDFETRAAMLKAKYPTALISPIQDHPSDTAWSQKLDELISKHFKDHEVILFGSRDSFIPFYKGVFPCRTVEEKLSRSASDVRKNIGHTVIDSVDFRRGVIYAATHQSLPTSYQAVDIVIKHSTEGKVLVGRKYGEEGWRFPGGFVDPADESLEAAAFREAQEEIGDVEISRPQYIASVRIKDYRYRKSQHKIMSALFEAVYSFGHIQAEDDLDEVRWQDIEGLAECMSQTHKSLAEIYLNHIYNRKEN